MLKEMAENGTSPYQTGKTHRVLYSNWKMKNLWKRLEVYRAMTGIHRPNTDIKF